MKKLTILFFGLLFSFTMIIAQQVNRDKVVLEVATATWCGSCPTVVGIIDQLLQNGCEIAVIEYHNGDSFTNTASNARLNYYGTQYLPSSYIDGVKVTAWSSYSAHYNSYLNRHNTPSSFTIDIDGSNTGLDYNVELTVEKVASTTSTNMVLHLVLTESHIPYNWQGLNVLHFVERLMAPNHNGTALNFSSSNTQVINLNFSINQSWAADNCELVAFIQDNTTKEVLQGIMIPLPDLGGGVLNADFIADFTEVCEGDIVNFTDNSTGEITSWEWSFPGGIPSSSAEQNPSVTYNTDGTYDVTLTVSDTSNSNTNTKADYITVNPLPNVTLEPFDDICLSDAAFDLTGGLPEGGTYSGTGVTNGWFNPINAGLGTHVITYTYSDVNQCENFAEETIYVDACTGISENNTEQYFEIFPNPNTGKFHIKYNNYCDNALQLRVFNSYGKLILDKNLFFNKEKISGIINMSDYAEGIYFIYITGDSTNFIKKLIIHK
ncbi:MAG: Omp28-related outer membrane protein [Bacteroidales bacterium]|nr:Omp28-related outer membrane protein [Bacteroidales bacterium]